MSIKTKQRLKAVDRRASILELSKKMFARNGLHGVSVNKIAEECNVSPAVLYQHFPSKDALYEAVIQTLAGKREDYVDAVLSGPTDFANVLYRMTVVLVKNRIADSDSVRIELRALVDDNKVSEQFFFNQWKGLTDYIQISLHEMMELEELEELEEMREMGPVGVRLAVLAYIGLVRELIIQLSLGDLGKNNKFGTEYFVKGIIDQFLRGVGLKPLQW
ncbi:MAG: AcrR, Transcriptional regulator [Candidatus Gallionella acididurans]|uniref:AcrR, Transcriptional regulator n=1 Tax=Candidatus Gallionella acididurans TaxID=1796491 RepID=A0A139BQI6_9PROT|nr:MAG: AcrR, Transcriptional regulator [Candidatus Gallionella acididurans]